MFPGTYLKIASIATMTKNFKHAADIWTDEDFLAWYYKENAEKTGAWEQWMAANPMQQALVQEARAHMDLLALNERPIDTATIEMQLKTLHARINGGNTRVIQSQSGNRRWWIAAAAILLVAVGSIFFWKANSSAPILASAYGQVVGNNLPDGSTMILNANSTATLGKNWENGNDREIWLKGEAFFKVTKTTQKSRFIVHTDQLDVIVTGTQFNVLTRDEKTTVLLTEGSVTIHTKDGKELAMQPGDYVEMNGMEIVKKEGRQDNVLAWKENKLAFDNTALNEVARIINYHYGVKVTLADSKVSAKSLTGIMSNNNLDDLLKAIEIALDIRITRSGDNIVFSTNK